MVNFFLGAMVGMVGGIFVMALLVMAKRGGSRDGLYEAEETWEQKREREAWERGWHV